MTSVRIVWTPIGRPSDLAQPGGPGSGPQSPGIANHRWRSDLPPRSIANAALRGQRRRPVEPSDAVKWCVGVHWERRLQLVGGLRRVRRNKIMLAEIKLNRLNGTTRECLERCYQSGSWLATLAEYAEHLRADGGLGQRLKKSKRPSGESSGPLPSRIPFTPAIFNQPRHDSR